MKDNTIHFHHIRNFGRSKKDNYTLAILPKENTIYVGISKCSRKDQFEKAKGRLIAQGRAEKAAAIDKTNDLLNEDYITWSISIPRAAYGLEGDRIKREVIAIATSEIKGKSQSQDGYPKRVL